MWHTLNKLLSLFTAVHCRCVSTGNEVLQRINAVPDRYFFDPNNTWHTVNGSDFSELTGVNPIDPTVVHTLGSIKLESLEIATVSAC
jgi:hypothetical protein